MTDEERKAWEELVKQCAPNGNLVQNRFHPIVLAADAELTSLRARIEDVEGIMDILRVEMPSGASETFLKHTAAYLSKWLKEGK